MHDDDVMYDVMYDIIYDIMWWYNVHRSAITTTTIYTTYIVHQSYLW